jgi:hypothetical protein
MAGRAETMQIVCDFSAAKILADGFCRDSDAHRDIDIRREALLRRNGRRARDAVRSCTWLPKLQPGL